MKVQEQDKFHGPGLVQIVEHESFKALNRGSSRYGHYLINTDRHVFAKYSSRVDGPWQFTFQPDELRAILAAAPKAFVMLACGQVTICPLSRSELSEAIDLKSSGAQTITVEFPKGGSLRVRGSVGSVSKTIPHNAFPAKLFD